MAIASHESFSGWTKAFTDPGLCAAIVARTTPAATATGPRTGDRNVTDPTPRPEIPTSAERAAPNAALYDRGRPAPWPDDIDGWRPEPGERTTREPGQHPF